MSTTRDALGCAAIAAAVFGAALLEGSPARPLALGVLSVGVAAPLMLRKRMPLTTAALSSLVALLGFAVPGWSGKVVAMAACGSAAYYRPNRLAAVLAVSILGFLAIPAVVASRPVGTTAVLTEMIITSIAPGVLGYAVRLRAERAEQLARLHRAEAARTVAEERAGIAREVHDAVGHHLTAIRMQATAARHVLTDASPVATTTLNTINDLAARALSEVRDMLETLRDKPSGSRIDEIADLVGRLSTSDIKITLTTVGDTGDLPPLVDHGGYRLAQEALTNAIRHSGADTIAVSVAREPDSVVITVEDNGSSTSVAAEGSGIRGMRERARLLGGSVTIGVAQPHGWRVSAVLPARVGR
ncbi:sensor histidine kinase [Allokutzneria sp. A3M-2-11 16]|uniref:sensor histidine kinase n=1 Tax=Allokutzneria sp. A3M-2-11 16 TaxID=2962043 RepID=UPI0020B705D6|nr:sensor histidine kinase [Allokutzneria sp. A3M-2-11 16]MCP3800231.1 sensor histidine kinase [Allokutzneria sp. A3M-2-11 16]